MAKPATVLQPRLASKTRGVGIGGWGEEVRVKARARILRKGQGTWPQTERRNRPHRTTARWCCDCHLLEVEGGKLCVGLCLRDSPASRRVLMWPQLLLGWMSKLDVCKGVLSPQKTETGTDNPEFLFQAPQQEGPKEHLEWPHFPETPGAHSPGPRIPYRGWRTMEAPSSASLSGGELISGHATHPSVLPTLPTLQPPLKGLTAQFLKIKARLEPWATSLTAPHSLLREAQS